MVTHLTRKMHAQCGKCWTRPWWTILLCSEELHLWIKVTVGKQQEGSTFTSIASGFLGHLVGQNDEQDSELEPWTERSGLFIWITQHAENSLAGILKHFQALISLPANLGCNQILCQAKIKLQSGINHSLLYNCMSLPPFGYLKMLESQIAWNKVHPGTCIQPKPGSF